MSPLTPPRNRAERRAALRKTAARAGAGAAALTASTAALLTGFVGVGPASGASQTFTVDSTGDGAADATHCTDGTADNCTLRDAVAAANANAGADTINFSGAAATAGASITLSNGQIAITDSVAITGPGSSVTTVHGDGTRIFSINGATIDVTISGLTFTEGAASGQGGAILNQGQHLVVENAVFNLNDAEDQGGAIASVGSGNTLVLRNSVFTENTSTGGGAIYADDSDSILIDGITATQNSTDFFGGGALYITETQGPATITNSTFSQNHSDGGGGALYLDDIYAPLTISNTVISNNTADSGGGGLYIGDTTDGPITLSHVTISNNTADEWGGGLYLSDVDDTLVIESSTISGNSASGGGGIYVGSGVDADVIIRNTTISGNTATDDWGGGLYIGETGGGQVQIFNSTISGNHADSGDGGGIWLGSYYGLTLVQTTITQNTATTVGGIATYGPRPVPSAHAEKSKNKPGDDGKPEDARVHAKGEVHATMYGEISAVGTIISANEGDDVGSGGTGVSGTVTSDHSLIGVIGSTVTLVNSGGTIRTSSPGLGPLANNGGPTQTHALLDGSPAINTGPVPTPVFTGSQYDQRGAGFARVSPTGGFVDIGAYEVQFVVVVVPPPFTG